MRSTCNNVPLLVDRIVGQLPFFLVMHSQRVALYTRILVRLCNENHLFRISDCKSVESGALWHDIGKNKVKRELLLKKEKLMESELRAIHLHVKYGHHMIDAAFQNSMDTGEMKLKRTAKDICLYHHEHYDGRGYPYGLASKDIPVAARLVALADAYDAMTGVRPYHSPIEHNEALDEIKRCSGKQFDPEMVELMIAYEKDFKIIGE